MNQFSVLFGVFMAYWFPNSDEPMPPTAVLDELKATGMSDREIRAYWWYRNPFHDLTWYRWGIVNEVKSGAVKHEATPEDCATKYWKPNGGFIYAYRIRMNGKKRRYISWSSSGGDSGWQFYLGVRPNGAWGIKLRRV